MSTADDDPILSTNFPRFSSHKLVLHQRCYLPRYESEDKEGETRILGLVDPLQRDPRGKKEESDRRERDGERGREGESEGVRD